MSTWKYLCEEVLASRKHEQCGFGSGEEMT